jgi:hypothetical protein
MNYCCQLFSVQGVEGIGQTEIWTAEPFVLEPSIHVVEIAFGKLKRCKLASADQVPAELIQAGVGGNTAF